MSDRATSDTAATVTSATVTSAPGTPTPASASPDTASAPTAVPAPTAAVTAAEILARSASLATLVNGAPHVLRPDSDTDDSDDDTGEPGLVVAAEVVVPAVPEAPVAPPFAELGVLPILVQALADQGIHTAFPIQTMAVPLALTGTDLIGQARTGTGKTLGFALPILQALALRSDAERGDRRPRALVVAPTRELASQVAGEFRMAGARLGARVATIYGGRAYEPQIAELTAGVDVVVGTPGRLLDLHGQRLLDLSAVGVLVLDEADEMLDLGFLPDVERIIAATPEGRQTMLFSATMPGAVVSLARRHLTNPVNLRAESAADTQMVPETTQFVYQVHAMDKIEIVARLLQARGRGLAMVFARTKRTAQRVADDLAERGFAAAPLHGDLGQGAREQALRAFRAGKVDVLVCTDVAARGIDVDGVTHVVNWACPEDERTYLHRIGRTGRAGATGIAVTFVDWEDVTRWRVINNALGLSFSEPRETYSTSPHLFTELDIPEGTKGTLPLAGRSRAGLAAETVEDLGGREPRVTRSSRPGDRDTGGRHGGGPARSGPGGRGGASGADGGPGREAGRARRAGTAGSGTSGGSASGGSASGRSGTGGSAGGSSAGGSTAGGSSSGGSSAGGSSAGGRVGGGQPSSHDSGRTEPVGTRGSYTIHNPGVERAEADGTPAGDGAASNRPPRHRRRTGGGESGPGATSTAAAETGPASTGAGADGSSDGPRRRRRRRSRGGETPAGADSRAADEGAGSTAATG